MLGSDHRHNGVAEPPSGEAVDLDQRASDQDPDSGATRLRFESADPNRGAVCSEGPPHCFAEQIGVIDDMSAATSTSVLMQPVSTSSDRVRESTEMLECEIKGVCTCDREQLGLRQSFGIISIRTTSSDRVVALLLPLWSRQLSIPVHPVSDREELAGSLVVAASSSSAMQDSSTKRRRPSRLRSTLSASLEVCDCVAKSSAAPRRH